MADAGQSRHRYHRYANPDYPRGYYGARLAAVRLRVRERCDELLRKAIAIDTPDPRYWNAYDACIGL